MGGSLWLVSCHDVFVHHETDIDEAVVMGYIKRGVALVVMGSSGCCDLTGEAQYGVCSVFSPRSHSSGRHYPVTRILLSTNTSEVCCLVLGVVRLLSTRGAIILLGKT